MAKTVLLGILKKSSAVGHSAMKSTHDSSRLDFLRDSALAATALCFTSSLASAGKILRSVSTSDPAISVLGQAYAGLAENYRQHQRNLSYTTSELRFSSDQRLFTQFKFTHQGGSGQNRAESSAAVQREIQYLARGINFTAEDFAANVQGFEPTVLLYQGRIHTDENLIKAVRPLCAAVVREHRKNSGSAPVSGIALSPKGSGNFHPWVLIS
jgi:hypothetical protein